MAKVEGLDKVLKQLKQFGVEADKQIGGTTSDIAKEIVSSAKTLAPKNLGKLSQGIYDKKVDDLNYEIVAGESYSAYVEFGTGKKVSVPQELSSLASKFKGNGGGFAEGLQSIRDWCKSKGIEESAAYPIFMSILRNGTSPQPFLYPAWKKGQKQYVKDLQQLLKGLTAKYN